MAGGDAREADLKTIDVLMVRVYLTEANGQLGGLLGRLHDWGKVRGVTVFRGITGFGRSGKMHSSALIDISLDLPVVIEFFDEPPKVRQMLEYLNSVIESGHIVSWPAQVIVGDDE
jgi:uncharacterized protein